MKKSIDRVELIQHDFKYFFLRFTLKTLRISTYISVIVDVFRIIN
jgi:hypothetical protein